MNIDSTPTPEHMTCVYTVPQNILQNLPPFPQPEVQIFVGDGYSAAMVHQLETYTIRGILNVAYDLDDQPAADEHGPYTLEILPDPHRPPPPSQGSEPPLRRYKQQFAKVGLIDGYGNIPNHMAVIAAVYMADQLLTFANGDKTVCPQLVNHYQRGNLLIHCWSGFSRSVTVAALYIWYKFGVALRDPTLKSFIEVYDMVKSLRGDSTQPITKQENPECVPNITANLTMTPPTCGMQEAALAIVGTYATLFPTITFS